MSPTRGRCSRRSPPGPSGCGSGRWSSRRRGAARGRWPSRRSRSITCRTGGWCCRWASGRPTMPGSGWSASRSRRGCVPSAWTRRSRSSTGSSRASRSRSRASTTGSRSSSSARSRSSGHGSRSGSWGRGRASGRCAGPPAGTGSCSRAPGRTADPATTRRPSPRPWPGSGASVPRPGSRDRTTWSRAGSPAPAIPPGSRRSPRRRPAGPRGGSRATGRPARRTCARRIEAGPTRG